MYYNMVVFILQVVSIKLLRNKVKYLQKGGVLMDIHGKLTKLMAERSWSEYRLAKECNLSQTTIYNIMTRNTVPNPFTLEAICKGFGITLSQFFAEGDMVELTPELKALFDGWVTLTPEQKQAVQQIIQVMNHDH